MRKAKKSVRCPVCGAFGSSALDGYCRQHFIQKKKEREHPDVYLGTKDFDREGGFGTHHGPFPVIDGHGDSHKAFEEFGIVRDGFPCENRK